MRDTAAQEFAERVAEAYREVVALEGESYPALVSLIATELRAGGWAGPHVPDPVDMADLQIR